MQNPTKSLRLEQETFLGLCAPVVNAHRSVADANAIRSTVPWPLPPIAHYARMLLRARRLPPPNLRTTLHHTLSDIGRPARPVGLTHGAHLASGDGANDSFALAADNAVLIPPR